MTRDFGSWWPSVDLLGWPFYCGHISIVIVTVITVTAQDTSVENPRRKHALWDFEINLLSKRNMEVPSPGHLIEFFFRQGLFSGRSQAGFIKRISPRSRAHSQLECLEENTFSQNNSCSHDISEAKVSASLLGHPLYPLKGEPAGRCLGVGRSCCGGPGVREMLASQLQATSSLARHGRREGTGCANHEGRPSSPWESYGSRLIGSQFLPCSAMLPSDASPTAHHLWQLLISLLQHSTRFCFLPSCHATGNHKEEQKQCKGSGKILLFDRKNWVEQMRDWDRMGRSTGELFWSIITNIIAHTSTFERCLFQKLQKSQKCNFV